MPTYQRATEINSWQRDPRIVERGYAHIWNSHVAPGNGEDALIELLDATVTADSDVLDVGCGHGELAMRLAQRCRSVVGAERVGDRLDLARELAEERGITNVRFADVDLAGPDDIDQAGNPRSFAPLPVPDSSIDVVVNRRGPMLTRYLDDARRALRGGGVLVGLYPNFAHPVPAWTRLLGPLGTRLGSFPFAEIASWVEVPLADRGLTDYRLWWLDVTEDVPTPRDLYDMLPHFRASVEQPPFEAVEADFQRVFDEYAGPAGLRLRHQRLLYRIGSLATQ